MKKLILSLVLALSIVSSGGAVFADNNNAPATTTCLGAERALRNSNGGDREHGLFGPAQSAYVKEVQPYGQWLQGWKANCN